MSFDFRLPDVGEGIDAAEIVEWHVAVGDEIHEDQPLADVETDKATVGIPCPTTGTVLELRAPVGDMVRVGDVLAVFAPAVPSPNHAVDHTAHEPSGATSVPLTPSSSGDAPGGAGVEGGRRRTLPLASPAVRKLARSRGVDLSTVTGSGPAGRITRDDLAAALSGFDGTRNESRAAMPGVADLQAGAMEDDQVVALRGTRRVIALALTESWRTIPHVIDYREVEVTELLETRSCLRESARFAGGEELAKALTLVPVVMKMVATVISRHPYVNASIDLDKEQITLHASVNVGVAIAAPQGLVVPVVRRVRDKSIFEIAHEVVDISAAAREGRLSPDQLQGATITVNNYGGLGIWLGTPIIAPGQVVNFGLGKLESRPVVRDGEIVARPIIPIAVSGDHRVVDGHTLAAFVSDVVGMMEQPSRLLADVR